MRKFNRSLAAAVLATTVVGGGYAFLGTALVPTAQARLEDHPKLAKAHEALKDAVDYLDNAPDEFHGHKKEAIKAIREAMWQIDLIVKDEKSADNTPFDPQPLAHPRLEHCREALKEAKHEMEEAKDNYHGHRDEAIKAIDEAIHQINRCLEE